MVQPAEVLPLCVCVHGEQKLGNFRGNKMYCNFLCEILLRFFFVETLTGSNNGSARISISWRPRKIEKTCRHVTLGCQEGPWPVLICLTAPDNKLGIFGRWVENFLCWKWFARVGPLQTVCKCQTVGKCYSLQT